MSYTIFSSSCGCSRWFLIYLAMMGWVCCLGWAAPTEAKRGGRALSPAAGAAAALDSISRGQEQHAPRWQVYASDNFTVFHSNAALAKQVADVAERERTVLRQIWSGEEEVERWSKRCSIYLYASHRQLLMMTGGEGKIGSAQVRPSKLYRGRILSRRVDLTADDRHLLDSTVPHEVSHLVFGDMFAGEIPLWANEGAATMAESSRKQRYYELILRRFLLSGEVFVVGTLFKMQRYPDFHYQSLYYAQSSSVVSFFLSLSDGPDFVRFVALAQRSGYPAALKSVYGINSLAELHRLWLGFVRSSS